VALPIGHRCGEAGVDAVLFPQIEHDPAISRSRG
jgi:hypothetical protein